MLEVLAYLKEIGQMHLGFGLESLSASQCHDFLKTLKKYGPEMLARQRALCFDPPAADLSVYQPLNDISRSGSKSDQKLGETLIAQGKVGCLILAGGQGTRLGHDGPKGTLAITPITGKSLFQLLCERIIWAGKRAERLLDVAIMTSSLNDANTRAYFDAHGSFGLQPSQLSFFSQDALPFLDEQGHWVLSQSGELAQGPNGNGNAFQSFYEQGIWDKWRKNGVEYLNVIFIDNPLADPFDSEFIGFTARNELDIGVKVIERISTQEKMGIVVQENERLKIVEYSEFSAEDSARYAYASPGLFCFHMPFIHTLYGEKKINLPLHLAHKTAVVIPPHGHFPEPRPVFKYEAFQFDLLDFTEKSASIAYARDRTYAPIKNATGEKSPSAARTALLAFDRKIYSELSGCAVPSYTFELDPAFYYLSDEMKQRMRGFQLPQCDYVRIENLYSHLN